MKKLLSLLIVLSMLFSLTSIASANEFVGTADTPPDATTYLTTSVPANESGAYILYIPENTYISFGTTTATIGPCSVEGKAGFTTGKNLKITVRHNEFDHNEIPEEENGNPNYHIPYTLSGHADGTPDLWEDINERELICYGQEENEEGETLSKPKMSFTTGEETTQVYVVDDFKVEIAAEDWLKAVPGEYTSFITFECEVVTKDPLEEITE